MNRRRFLASTASLVAGASSLDLRRAEASSRSILDHSLADLAQAIASGHTPSRTIVRQYLRRIAERDRRGPNLRAVLVTHPDAPALATQRDHEARHARLRGPLHGVPILVKDNLDTADSQPTTAGSLALAGTPAPRDAFVVQRLRDAGAIILGKTNLSEWANFRSTRSTSGWSAVGGQTRNPYALDRNPSGSSSGSAAAVAAGFAPAAIGTETDGSIVSPSCHGSLVGLKPTVGLISRRGIIPISESQDTAGPMTRTVADAAFLLGILAGEDPEDPATAPAREHARRDYTRFLDRDALRGKRLGVLRRTFGGHPEIDRHLERQLLILRDLGATLVDPVVFPTWPSVGAHEIRVLLYEFKDGIARYLATRNGAVPHRNLADLIAFNDRQQEREMPFFGQELFHQAQACGPLTDPAYLTARAECVRLARTEGIQAVLDQHRLDAVVGPTETSLAWPIDPILGDRYGDSASTLPAVAGTPHLTVPAGYVRGLPVGLSFLGRAWSEPELLALGFAYEQATQHRRAPDFPSSVDHRTA